MGAVKPLILLPPSEGKAPGGRGGPWAVGRMSHPGLDPIRTKVCDALVAYLDAPGADPAKLLGASGPTLEGAAAANRTVLSSPTMPAYLRYCGVVHQAADLASLGARRRAQVRILSGLWGLVAATDPVPAYRLKMSASLPGLGRLAPFWRPALTEEMAAIARRRVIFDLLPQEHAAAWVPAHVAYAQRLTVRFVEERPDGTRMVVSHNAKTLKGQLARYLLESDASSPAAVRSFAVDGYELEPGESDLAERDARATFVRRR